LYVFSGSNKYLSIFTRFIFGKAGPGSTVLFDHDESRAGSVMVLPLEAIMSFEAVVLSL
jgi:hypothetical protein